MSGTLGSPRTAVASARRPRRQESTPRGHFGRTVYFRSPARGRGTSGDRAGQPTLLLTVEEACQALRISRWTFYRLVQRRSLRTIRIGSRRLIPVGALRTLIDTLAEEEEDAS